MLGFFVVQALVLAKGQFIEGYKPTPGCFVVNLSLTSQEDVQQFINERPSLRPTYVWSRGFAVSRTEKAALLESVLYADQTVSVEECGQVLLHGAAQAAGINWRALDRLDQLYRAPDGWMRRTAFQTSTPIYLVDSGLTFAQQQRPNVQNLWSFQGQNFDDDLPGHGLFMFELIRGDLTGPALGAPIFNLRAFSSVLGGGGGLDTLKAALEWIYQNRATLPRGVINLSLGQVTMDQSLLSSLQIAVDSLVSAGFIVVASAGNEGQSIVDVQTGIRRLPAAFPNVVTVGGVSFADESIDARWVNTAIGKASNFGPEIDLFAPADKQPAFDRSGNFTVQQATSGAAAYVSAVLATVGTFKPLMPFGQHFVHLASKLNNSGISDARSPNTGMLFSDLGYVPTNLALQFSAESRRCDPFGPGSPAPKQAEVAIASLQGYLGSYPAGIVVASLVHRHSGCPGVPLNGGAVDLVIERFDRQSGLRLWRRTIADPDRDNVSFSDHIGFLAEWNTSGNGRSIVLGFSSNEPGRFGAPLAATNDLDMYVVGIEPATGQLTGAPYRLSGLGNQMPRGAVELTGPTELSIVGVTDSTLDGQPISGSNDIFAVSLSTALTAASPVAMIRIAGTQRLGAVRALGPRQIVVGGGTTVSKVVSCQAAPVDSYDSLIAQVSVPAAVSPSLVATSVFESPTAISPAIQLDDWIDSIAGVESGSVVVGVTSRQFDCTAGGIASTGTDSAQALKVSLSGVPAWYQSRGIQNLSSPVRLFGTGEPGLFLDYHLVAKGVAWKFNSAGTHQAFQESVPAGLAVFDGENYAWFGECLRV